MIRNIRIKRNIFYKVSLLLTFFALVFSLPRIFQLLSNLNFKSCPNYEPIDVVYTWVNGSDPKFLKDLHFYMKLRDENIDSSQQRFDDKNELKFSLRSLEKYAPWVNHVYIVTNGQIPYWLDLDYEKVTIVTHEDIFKDKFNLPTFSSPAIECNLHRIPGLSKRFIYFNDDVFLGLPTYIEDFYSPNKGFIIYLAWSVPQCGPNCPWMYVNDGQCDKACNNLNCQYDGKDCLQKEHVTSTEEPNLYDTEFYNKKMLEKIEAIKNHLRTHGRYKDNNITTHLRTVSSHKENISISHGNFRNDLNLSHGKNLIMNLINPKNSNNLTKVIKEHNRKILRENKLKRTRRKWFHEKFSKINGSHTAFINIDAYSESLQYTNRVLNKKYGFYSRKVPSHAPILIDKYIMKDLQKTFAKEFEITERNRFRKASDMQFSFSYYYFVISEKKKCDIGDIFDRFDTDGSSTWSDREIRNILAKLYELPLSFQIVDGFEDLLINCTKNGHYSEVTTPLFERYIDSRLKTISKDLVINCGRLSKILKKKFENVFKYQYEIVRNSENKYVSFKMLKSNITDVVGNLDDIRSKTKKFICLNDNLDASRTSENELLKAVLYDFYLSLFPHPSKFELPEESRNRFLHMSELNEWKNHHLRVKYFLFAAVLGLICLLFLNVFKKVCCQFFNKLFF